MPSSPMFEGRILPHPDEPEFDQGLAFDVGLATDNVFGDDGGVRQLGSMSGTTESGLTVELLVPVSL